MIIIDGKKSSLEISNFDNLEKLLTTVQEEPDMQNRVITDVIVNEEPFSEIYPHQAEDISSASLSKVEVKSVTADQMALDISGEMQKVATLMSESSSTVAQMFRETAGGDALEMFQDLLDVTKDFMATITELNSFHIKSNDVLKQTFEAAAAKLADLLSEMTDVLEKEDWILLADLLEYEFRPLCAEWKEISNNVHKEIAKNLSIEADSPSTTE